VQAQVAAMYAAIEELAVRLSELRDIVEGLEARALDITEDAVHAAGAVAQLLL
jgi:hypothetical protein